MGGTVGLVRTDTPNDPDALWGMSPVYEARESRQLAKEQAVRHAKQEFLGGIAFMLEGTSSQPLELTNLISALMDRLERNAPPKTHPYVKIALGGIVAVFMACLSLAYGYGVLNARVTQVEQVIPRVTEAEKKTAALETALARIETKLDMALTERAK